MNSRKWNAGVAGIHGGGVTRRGGARRSIYCGISWGLIVHNRVVVAGSASWSDRT